MPQARSALQPNSEEQTPLRRRQPLLTELNDLKRVRVAGEEHTLAAAIFRRAWKRLLAGDDPRAIAECETAHALAAARLGGINRLVMSDGGLTQKDINAVLERSFDQVTAGCGEEMRKRFRHRLGDETDDVSSNSPLTSDDVLPAFVERLACQPRAGATRPGRGRVVLEPAENHAEHCATVAVYAALLADIYETDATLPFFAGLSHHLHNAYLPDAGYAADQLLGEHSPKMIEAFRRRALDEIPKAVRPLIEESLRHTRDATTEIARAFQAADVLDRVLEMRWHAQTAAFTLDVALGEMDIVHPGVTQEFHLSVMHDAGLSVKAE